MDPTSALFTIGGAGISLLKFINESRSKLQNGPKNVTQLSSIINDLLALLAKVVKAIESEQSAGRSVDVPFQEMLPMLQRCNSDLEAMHSQLEKLDPGKRGISWKSVKMFLSEKDVDNMSKRLSSWMQALIVPFTHAGASASMRNRTSLQEVHQSIETLTKESRELRERVEMKELTGEHATHTTTQRQNEMLGVLSKLDLILEYLNNFHIATPERLPSPKPSELDDARRALDLQRLINENLAEKIRSLQTESKQAGESTDAIGSQRVTDDRTSEPKLPKLEDEVDKMILQCLEKISRYQAINRDLSNGNTHAVIQDLDRLTLALWRSIESQEHAFSCHHERTFAREIFRQINDAVSASRGLRFSNSASRSTYKRCASSQAHATKRRRISNEEDLIDNDFQTSVAHKPTPGLIQTESCLIDRPIHQQTLRNRFHRKFNEVGSMSSSKNTAQVSPGNCFPTTVGKAAADHLTTSNAYYWRTKNVSCLVQFDKRTSELCENDFAGPAEEQVTNTASSMRVTITPLECTSLKHQVILDAIQERVKKATAPSVPVLTYRPILPFGSEVFKTVQYGLVQDLRKLFDTREASLWAVDPSGRSLLNYALQASRPSIVDFLVRSGADVDALELDSYNYLRIPFSQINSIESEKPERYRFLAGECRKTLLSSGADPTLLSDSGAGVWDCGSFDIYNTSVVSWFPGNRQLPKLSVVEYSVTALLNHNEFFHGPNTALADGTFPILLICHSMGAALDEYELHDDILALLLSRGANCHQRDSLGNTPLHTLFRGAWETEEYHPVPEHLDEGRLLGIKDALTMLVSAGADVLAINDAGLSVSDLAKDTSCFDLWIGVLRKCGFDPELVTASRDTAKAVSTAIDLPYQGRLCNHQPRLSLQEYLSERQSDHRPKIFDTDVEEAAHVHDLSNSNFPFLPGSRFALMSRWSDDDQAVLGIHGADEEDVSDEEDTFGEEDTSDEENTSDEEDISDREDV